MERIEKVIRERLLKIQELHQSALQKIDLVALRKTEAAIPAPGVASSVGDSSSIANRSISVDRPNPMMPDETKLLRESLAEIRMGFDQLDRLSGDVVRFIEDLNANPNSVHDTSFARQIRQTTASATKLFKRIYDDPLASTIAYAPPKSWSAVVNHTKARTHFGNADIAIVMESSGDYTIKGMRNDASQATKAALTMLNQTVTTVAGAYGVGFSSSSQDTTQSFSREIIDAEAQFEQYKRSSRTTQLAILEAILTQQANIVADTAIYRPATRSIRKVFEVQKATLTKQP